MRKARLVWKLVKDVLLVLITLGWVKPEEQSKEPSPLTPEEVEQVTAFMARHGTSQDFAQAEVRRLNAQADIARAREETGRQAKSRQASEDWWTVTLFNVVVVGLMVALCLGVLYALVRFVKWAWTD